MSAHWNEVYATKTADQLSWFEPTPVTSLALVDTLGVAVHDGVLDVGGGESRFVDHLLARGFDDVSVLDLSSAALAITLARVASPYVTTYCDDVTTFAPDRTFALWHDRAVLHFLGPDQASAYVATLRRVLAPTGALVIGVFSPDGPTSCSGLPVTRYDAAGLAALLGPEFDIVDERRAVHVTPWAAEQSFQWVAARRRASEVSAPVRRDVD